MIKKILTFILLINLSIFASDHGIYLQLIKNSSKSIDEVSNTISNKLSEIGFQVIALRNVATPDIVRKTESEKCGFSAKEIIFTSNDYKNMLTSYGNKYIVAGLLRLAVYQDERGTEVNIVDPETINRIIFNDLYENDEEAKYNEVITKTGSFKSAIIDAVHSLSIGENIARPLPPIRSDEDLAESSKDMFMMVGPMTFFNDEDQFPIIYKEKVNNVQQQISNIVKKITENIANFKPTKDDYDYRFTKSDDVLRWKIVAKIYSSDKSALLLGITRSRTEGLSMDIAGNSRETVTNRCPGIDHSAAFPIEVLIYREGNNLLIRTPREMFRMDMFFWDAGMKAFMNHMSMPKILDNSIKQILTIK